MFTALTAKKTTIIIVFYSLLRSSVLVLTNEGRGVSIYIGWRMNSRVSVATKNMCFWCVVADDGIYTAFATMYVLPTSPFHTILLARLQLLKEFWVCLRFKFQKLQMTFKNWFGRIKRQSNIFFDKIAKKCETWNCCPKLEYLEAAKWLFLIITFVFWH